MGKQLDRRDVGIAVHDPARHARPCIRLGLGDPAQPRHDLPQHDPIGRDPGQERQRQAPVLAGRQDQRAQEIDHDIGAHIGHLHRDLAHGQGRLHQSLRDPAREFVLEVSDRLAQQIPVRPPADALREIAHQTLIQDQGSQQVQRGQHQQKHKGHEGQPPAVQIPELVARGLRQLVDQFAQPAEQHDLDDRDQGRRNGHQQQPRDRALAVIQHEPDQRPGRHLRRFGRIRVDASFEPRKHGVTGMS